MSTRPTQEKRRVDQLCGVVREPGKLDLAMIFGTGFPPFRGGLLAYADSLGLNSVFSQLNDLAARLGARFAPAELIRQLARAGQTFYTTINAEPKERAS